MDYITEKSEFVDNNIPLLKTDTPVKGYDGKEIGQANIQAQVLGNRTLWLKDANTETNKQVTQLINGKEASELKHAEAINALKTGKQDTLVSGTNVNTVFGQSLTDVKEGGITLSDAKDFFQVLKTHLKVTDGLSLSEDGQSLILASHTGGSNGVMNIRSMTTVRSNTLVEFKARQRPTFDFRAYVFRVSSVSAQPNTAITLNSYLDDRYTTPYTGSDEARISFTPDANERLRWSALNTISVPNGTHPDTRIAISPDNENWYVFNNATREFDNIGALKLDQASAKKLVQKGTTVSSFNSGAGTELAEFLSGQTFAPQLNMAFAATVNSGDQDFIPASFSVTFNESKAWLLQPVSDVPTTITSDTILFIPRQAGEYIFCFQFQD